MQIRFVDSHHRHGSVNLASTDRQADNVKQWDRLFLEVMFWIPWYDSLVYSSIV